MRIFAILLALLGASTAGATIITIEPDSYRPGQDLSNLGEGARLYSFTNVREPWEIVSPSLASVYAQRNQSCVDDPYRCDAATGAQGFGNTSEPLSALYGDWFEVHAAANCWQWFNTGGPSNRCDDDPFRAMLIEFDRPTDYVEISGALLSDPPSMIAFDADFNILGGCGYGDGPNCSGLYNSRPSFEFNLRTVSLITETPLISYVLAGGTAGNSSLDNLRYRVPEPGTLALFALGLLGLGIRRKGFAGR